MTKSYINCTTLNMIALFVVKRSSASLCGYAISSLISIVWCPAMKRPAFCMLVVDVDCVK